MDTNTNAAPWYTSSEDPTKLSATITGAIIGFSGIALFAAHAFGIPLTNTDLVALAGNIGIAVGALWFLFGFLRKVFFWFFKKTPAPSA